MLKIWGRANSTNVKKVLWSAEELGLPYEHINAGGAFGIVDEPAYRAMNPNGLVPCIEDDGLVLWESNAIVRYLAARYGAGTLHAEDAAERADGDRWMDWTATTFAPPFRDAFWNLMRLPPEQRDMAAVERGLKRGRELLAIADAALAKTPYLSGERFRMGDIPLGPLLHAWRAIPIEHAGTPNLDAWYGRLAERPAFRKTVMSSV